MLLLWLFDGNETSGDPDGGVPGLRAWGSAVVTEPYPRPSCPLTRASRALVLGTQTPHPLLLPMALTSCPWAVLACQLLLCLQACGHGGSRGTAVLAAASHPWHLHLVTQAPESSWVASA